MKLKKGKLYEMIWVNPRANIHVITMDTAYKRSVVYVSQGKILLHLGSKKIYHTVPATTTTEEIKLSWRRHKFLYQRTKKGPIVVSWDEKENFWEMQNGIAGVFKEIET